MGATGQTDLTGISVVKHSLRYSQFVQISENDVLATRTKTNEKNRENNKRNTSCTLQKGCPILECMPESVGMKRV